VWETGTYAFRYHQNLSSFADIVYHNSQDNENLFWNPEKLQHSHGGKRGRRLTRVVAAEEIEHDEDMNDDYIPEEDYDDDEDEDYRDESRHSGRGKYYDNNPPRKTGERSDGDDAPKDREKRQELMELIQKQRFSKSRVAMVDKASILLETIEKLMKDNEEEANNEEEDDEPEIEKSESDDETSTSETEKDVKKEEETKATNVDPLALPMVKSQLEKRKKTIQRGLDYAVSAKVLLDAVKETMADDDALKGLLQRLSLGTLNHGKLSAVQFYEILASVVPGLENVITDSQTCQPRSEICPPRSIERGYRIPPISVSERVEAFCAQALTAEPPPGVCVVGPGSESSTMDEIPSNVSDGYFGYFVVTPRGDDDLFHHVFQSMEFSAKGNEELEIEAKYLDLKENVNNLDKEVNNLKKKLDKLENSLSDPEKYGPDGELHAISDQCFEVEEGKYVYQVCMFQNAYQRDKGSSGQGTDLGRWEGASTETVSNEQGVEYPRRVWKWDNGTKCWNGPVRSVTAYVDCGPETKVLSANEPDTCRYVLEMQSPVACDEDYQSRHGLS
jgi:protein kinase C substrate 80K-H